MNNNLIKSLDALLEGDNFEISILANTSAFINDNFKNLNWVGFYLLKDNTLYLGPFQGRVACTTIPVGKGVCGTSILKDESIIVPDVDKFPGHIVCDSASKSEIVIPIKVNNKQYGVLDIDSPTKDRFSFNDKVILEALANVLEKHLNKLL